MPRVRIVLGHRLVSTVPGYWRLESNPEALFQFFGRTRLGPSGARYSVEKWLTPGGETTTSLESAVKRHFRRR